MTDKINLTQLMERAWADDGLRQDFATHFKAVYAREIGEVIPDFIDIKLLQENPKLVWLVIPPKPPNWPNITEVPDEPHLKPNDFYTNPERSAAVKAAIAKGEIGFAQMMRAALQSHITYRAWEKDGYMQELLVDAKPLVQQAIADLGLPMQLPDDLEIRAIEDTATRRYMVMATDPRTPEPIGFERALKVNCERGTSSSWHIANSASWGYTVARHGITLPYCGAFVIVAVNNNAPNQVPVGSFTVEGKTYTFALPA